jgi:hypothetical protein
MMHFDITPPMADSVEYKLSQCFYKGGGGSNKIPETSQERAAAEIALKRYQRYANVYRPFEEAAFKEMTSDVNAQRFQDRTQGIVNANQAQMLAKGTPAGVDPTTGAFKSALGDRQMSQDYARTMGRTEGLARDQQIAGLQAAVNIGTGQANEAQVSSDALAGAALDESIGRAQTRFNERNAKLNATMTGIGMLGRAGQYAWDNRTTPSPAIGSGLGDNVVNSLNTNWH